MRMPRVKKYINVMSVGKLSPGSEAFRYIGGSIMERNHTHGQNVERPSSHMQNLPSIRGFTARKKPINVKSVGKASVKRQDSSNILKSTLEKSPINVVNVADVLVGDQFLRSITVSTLEINLWNV